MHHNKSEIETIEISEEIEEIDEVELGEKPETQYSKLGNFSVAKIIALFMVAILIINTMFSFDLTVRRRTWLGNILGKNKVPVTDNQANIIADQKLEEEILPVKGIELPAVWGDLGVQLVKVGVIDQKKFEALYQDRGGLSQEMQKLLTDVSNGRLRITRENAQVLLNLLWALGLGSDNVILKKGEMMDKKYGGAGKFASTGGWTLARGDAMNHYAKHALMNLTPEQQDLVDRVSRNIYRPCCGNSTHFPDCNHGMAMLGLLELMASQGVGEADMYKAALAVNSFWFPNNYLTIAKYLKTQDKSLAKTDPREILNAQYSSSAGYKQVLNQVAPVNQQSGGGCGV